MRQSFNGKIDFLNSGISKIYKTNKSDSLCTAIDTSEHPSHSINNALIITPNNTQNSDSDYKNTLKTESQTPNKRADDHQIKQNHKLNSIATKTDYSFN